MNPAARLSLALLVGLALTFPTINACIHGNAELPTVATRYLEAFVFSWAGIAGVMRLFESYLIAAHTVPESVMEDHPRRRSDDEPSVAGAQ